MANLFEDEIAKSIKYFEERGVLMGEKILEKVPFGRRVSYGRSKFDFWILKDEKFFAIECKMQRKTESFSFSSSIIDQNQIRMLQMVEQHGGYGMLAARMEYQKEKECFIMNIHPLLKILEIKKRRSIPIRELRNISIVQTIPLIETADDENSEVWDLSRLRPPSYYISKHDLEGMKEGKVNTKFSRLEYDNVVQRKNRKKTSNAIDEFEKFLNEMSEDKEDKK